MTVVCCFRLCKALFNCLFIHVWNFCNFQFLCSGLLCKVSAGNDVACLTTNHLAALAKLEPRLVPLVLAFRYWARVRLCGHRHLSWSQETPEKVPQFRLIQKYIFTFTFFFHSCVTSTARPKEASPHTPLPSWSSSSCSRERSPSSLSTWDAG